MFDLVLKNGRVIDPAHGVDATTDLAIRDGRVAALGAGLAGAEGIDCTGLVVCPGLIDLHVHLRDPGQEWKEDLLSGAQAAAAGGFTTLCCMPNTVPTNDTGAITRDLVERAVAIPVHLRPVGAISRGLAGKELAEIGEMVSAGAVAISDDGCGVQDGHLMRHAMEYARPFKIPVIIHPQDDTLFGHGVMNEGWRATELGLAGIPAAAEEAQIDRDIRLSALTGTRLHVAHLSTAGGVELVRRAQAAGVAVSAEATPHHLLLTDADMPAYDTHWKMSPPLRGAADRAALVAALADGTIQAIATDHAPHAPQEKELPFDDAPFGVIGLETCLGVVLALVRDGRISLADLLHRLTAGPARILGLATGHLAVGAVADLCCFDPQAPWRVEPERFYSKSRNSPWAGQELTGRPLHTILAGRIVCRDGTVVEGR
ncbi:MAG: dihydroorotase [Nitrospirae bacterium CG18_big_fil_WC_8_21_14_2_50_70_55]|nr:dihydroorotase [Deltaproteobacteria bacterium]OIP67215.1 MAG: hypothetical protein AUK30_01115 [Nitrospirae bacterium CG2_30_70_394]PIQ04890.1 MAG: dihydroorotase [Nitrospirae bacterium CG18_big_fil_WC_8_21_14_2_50_70_55]PIU78092.1 MAG: dihydroorotase [Nitrospirae bacterium CG06_land_8_20_14_3_00_70_43]PIW82171.1 MAG: dihydroorotase [Nitrospirae bacterium CG_4_8_14_3_um_filter_70_85]PIX82657.1 MAG: dihydroorotase [Nitrospirae bacterium CG_4_10_14_3_um_filter_70_108]